MSWSALANNQMVNQDDAVTSPFSLNSGQSHGSGQLCFTKAMALTKYNLDASAMSAYASNQLVPKQTWVAGAVVPTDCYQFDVYVAESDLILSDDSTVTFEYANCSGGISQTIINDPGTYMNLFCAKNLIAKTIIVGSLSQDAPNSGILSSSTPC